MTDDTGRIELPDPRDWYDGPKPSEPQTRTLNHLAAHPGGGDTTPRWNRRVIRILFARGWITHDYRLTEAGLRALYSTRKITYTEDTAARLARGAAHMSIRERTFAHRILPDGRRYPISLAEAEQMIDTEFGGPPACRGRHHLQVVACAPCGFRRSPEHIAGLAAQLAEALLLS